MAGVLRGSTGLSSYGDGEGWWLGSAIEISNQHAGLSAKEACSRGFNHSWQSNSDDRCHADHRARAAPQSTTSEVTSAAMSRSLRGSRYPLRRCAINNPFSRSNETQKGDFHAEAEAPPDLGGNTNQVKRRQLHFTDVFAILSVIMRAMGWLYQAHPLVPGAHLSFAEAKGLSL